MTNVTPDKGIREAFSMMAVQEKMTVVPIVGGRDRLGTLVLLRNSDAFNDDDLILAEYGSTIVGMEILRERAEEIEVEARSRAVAAVAVGLDPSAS